MMAAATASLSDVALMFVAMAGAISLLIWVESGLRHWQQLLALPIFLLDMITFMASGRTVSRDNTWYYLHEDSHSAGSNSRSKGSKRRKQYVS